MTDDYDAFTQRMTSFDMVLGDEDPMAHSENSDTPVPKSKEGEEVEHTNTDAFLSHYGVKGMKWGVRRAEKAAKKAQQRYENSSDDSKAAQDATRKIKSGSVDSLSNKELQALVTRMNLEQQLSGLQEKAKTKSAGRKFAEEIAREQFKNTVSGAIRDSIGVAGKKILADEINKKIKNMSK